jgi:hypothetical protein
MMISVEFNGKLLGNRENYRRIEEVFHNIATVLTCESLQHHSPFKVGAAATLECPAT